MTRFITATQARKVFFQLIRDTNETGDIITITVDGLPKAIMMPNDEFEGWMETVEIMSDPEAMKGIREGMKDAEEGNVYTLEEVKKELFPNTKKKKSPKKRSKK